MRHMVAALLLVLTLATPAVCQTQITSGVIQGTVADATGGAIPGASVEIKNLDTNINERRTTDNDGRFVAVQLQPGRYSVTITMNGFATFVPDGIELTVGQNVTLLPRLAVSAIQQTVTVTGTPTVDTTRSGIASTLDEKVVGTLPILGRKFEDFLTLTPGVSVVQGPDGDEISFAGQR